MNNLNSLLKCTITILLFSIVPLSSNISAVELHIDTLKQNRVVFISDAPLEDFEGVTDEIDGYVYWDGDLTKGTPDYSKSEFVFEVFLDGFDTGIGLMNRHMRENFLETDKYPYAQYVGKLVDVVEIAPDSFEVVSEGVFSLHGVEKNMKLNGVVTRGKNTFRVAFKVKINLNDFKIEIPTLMFMKVSEIAEITLDFYLFIFKE